MPRRDFNAIVVLFVGMKIDFTFVGTEYAIALFILN
jgi:hypothetical protein